MAALAPKFAGISSWLNQVVPSHLGLLDWGRARPGWVSIGSCRSARYFRLRPFATRSSMRSLSFG